MIAFTIFSQLASMKNRRRPDMRKPGVTHLSREAKAFERDFMAQVPRHALQSLGSLRRPLRATVTVYYRDMRSDVEVEFVYDLCQKAGVVRNDRYIREKHVIGRIDKDNPRVEICLEELN